MLDRTNCREDVIVYGESPHKITLTANTQNFLVTNPAIKIQPKEYHSGDIKEGGILFSEEQSHNCPINICGLTLGNSFCFK